MKRALLLLAAALGGCATPPVPPPTPPAPAPTKETTPLAIESSAQFLPLDPTARESILCTALAQHALADGRLEVMASLRNQAAHPIRIAVECVFKDNQGEAVGEAAPGRTIEIGGDSTETVRFVAADTRAERFTIAVKAAP